MQTALIAELADTVAIRASTTCRADVSKAVGKYVLVHKHKVGRLQLIALDRALAASCSFDVGETALPCRELTYDVEIIAAC